MAYNNASNGMNNELSEFEEILNQQRQGRRLTDVQLQSLNQFIQTRNSNAGGISVNNGQMPSQYPPMAQHQMMTDGNMPYFPAAQQQYQNQFPTFGNEPHWLASNDTNINRQDMNPHMGPHSHHPPAASRRRSSMAMYSNFINEMGYNPDGTEQRRAMKKRSSLDLLGDTALALSNQDHMGSASTAANGFMGSMDQRSSLDFLVSGDATLGRRNSITQMLANEFANPSRKSSMGTGAKPIDPYHMDNLFDDQAKLAAVGLAFPANPPPGADMMTLQLWQQRNEDEEHALSNVEEYIKLQKLQTCLRRQSISNMFDEITLMQQLNQAQGLNTQQPDSMKMEEFQIYQEKQHQKHNQQIRKRSPAKPPPQPEPEPEPEIDEVPLCTEEQMDSFATSMDKSIHTQTNIQQWDKKMGLKRSHSATMTKTTRSRKNLKKILDKHKTLLKEFQLLAEQQSPP